MKKRYSPLLGALVAVALAAVAPAQASFFVGDLVYCDVDRNGIFDGADYPLNGVRVDVVCVPDNSVEPCFETTATTHGPPVGVDGRSDFGAFPDACPNQVDYTPVADTALPEGRYLVEVSACIGTNRPWTCTVTVDPSSLPAECNGLVTPRVGGFPVDDGDGLLCDVANDGPFPEGQPLGNIDGQGGCFAYPDPLPSDGQFTTVFQSGLPLGMVERCNLQDDFGYTPPPDGGGETRTPGYWKNHPGAIDDAIGAAGGSIDFCGVTYTAPADTCDVVDVVNTGGGGLNQFLRHGMAATLNCAWFGGCPAEIEAILAAGSAACAAGDDNFDYGAAGTILDIYNNSNETGDNPPNGNTDKKRCKDPGNGKQTTVSIVESDLRTQIRELRKQRAAARGIGDRSAVRELGRQMRRLRAEIRGSAL